MSKTKCYCGPDGCADSSCPGREASGPTGTEARVCADIARRLRVGAPRARSDGDAHAVPAQHPAS